MTVLAFALFAAAVVVMVAWHVHLENRLERRIAKRQEELDRLDEERRKALYKQQKQFHRTIEATDRAVKRLSDQVRGGLEDTRLNLERADQLYRDFKEGVR